ncbi:MAG TPA: cohesin domain-containing protein [Bryobacteraceae bacterium]|nr:cohesin domain-containing protein [Bryobacteraceae bacterium]
MLNSKPFIINALAVLLSISLAAPDLGARTKKGEKLLKEGRLAESKKDYDKALELFEQAQAEDPQDAAYQMAAQRVRFQAGLKHVDLGKKLREEGKLEEAVAEFKRAVAIDPASSLARNELSRTLKLIDQGKGGQPNASLDSPAEAAEKETERRIASIQDAPVLKPLTRQVSQLRMNNQPIKVLYETLGKLTGVNVVFDPEFQNPGKNYSMDVARISLEQALDQLAVLTKTYWKPLSDTTIFVTNDNVTKLRDFQDMVVKTFYVKNITQPQELQEIATALRTLTDIRRVLTYNAHSALMVRGTVDQVALAEKVIADLDKPKSEVVIDVVVMEANRTRTRDLAASILAGGSAGLQLPIAFTPRSSITTPGGTTAEGETPSTSTAIPLSNLKYLKTGDWSMTLPGALIQALMSDRGTRVMQSPQVRAVDSVKSSLKIGDRYPYATGSFQPGVGSVGVSPLVSTQFNFADVGVNVDITPKIHSADEVSLAVEIDVSNIRDQIDVGGLTQPVIGQRKLSHTLRLRQGEMSILGGLVQDQDTKTVNGVAGLGSIPILGRLFSSESIERGQSELMIVIIPHIVRSLNLDDRNLKGVAAGTEQVVKLSYSARGEPEAGESRVGQPLAPPPQGAKGVMEQLIPGAPAAPAGTPAPATPEAPKPTETPAPQPPAAEPPKTEAPKPAAGGGVALRFQPERTRAALGGVVVLTLTAEGASDLFGAPMQLSFDPKVLRLNDVIRGNLMAGDGQTPIFSRNIRNDAGEATIVLNRLPGSPGVNGSGGLVTLMFQVVGKGSTDVRITELTLRNSQMQPLSAAPPVANVTVE